MTMAKQETRLTNLLMVLACISITWMGMELGLVQADDQSEETSMTLSEVTEMLQPFAQSCEPVPTKDQMEEVVMNKEQPSHESKCFRRCLLQQFDVMGEGSTKYNATKTVDMMNMMYPDKNEQSQKIVDTCNQANGITDECEVAHTVAMCMLREMRQADYKIPDIKE
ncbi:uncharacterized protein LOC117788658 [Drosophila innubila]|uniref:uncharacterized protein LOC117788658 n=1 Tax=Drosophila innubila TaxID=198719 RepID=UPI00148E4BB3|nr:uncharacterized protein LOC117788658 [Drosophila innubila]